MEVNEGLEQITERHLKANGADFFRRVWKAGPSEHPWDEQARIMECVHQLPAAVQAVSNEWNATESMTPMKKPVIKAWHGAGNVTVRSALMCAELRHWKKSSLPKAVASRPMISTL